MAKLHIRYLLEKRLADGTVAYYYNAPRDAKEKGILESCSLGSDKSLAVERAENYNGILDSWRRGDKPKSKSPGSIGWLIEEYKKSSWYLILKPKSKSGYDADLTRIEDYSLKSGKKLGTFLATAITPQIADAMYLKLQACDADKNPTKLRTANGVMMIARRLWNYGKRYHATDHKIRDNPFSEMGLKTLGRRSHRWTRGEVERFVKKADEMGASSVGTAAQICYLFNQRITTAITVAWTSWDGSALFVEQSKTDVLVWVPALPELQTRLNKLKQSRSDAVQIVIDERTGQPYDEFSFSHRCHEIRVAAEIPMHLQMRDLKRTGTTETRKAGATLHELQAITGNSLESLEIYSVASNEEASSAIAKREAYRTEMQRKSE